MLGVVGLTTSLALSRLAEATSAERAEDGVRTLARLDEARSSVEREIIPFLTLTLIDDPVTSDPLGLPAAVLLEQRNDAVTAGHEARTRTDEALERIPTGSPGADAAARAVAVLADLRTRIDAHELDVQQVYLGYLDVSTDLMNAQQRAASTASAEQVAADALQATADVQLVAELAQAASRQTPLFLGAHLDDGQPLQGSRLAWDTAWVAYTDAQGRMDDLSQQSLREEWWRVRASSVVSRLDQTLGAHADSTADEPVSVGQLLSLLVQTPPRDRLLAELVDTAVHDAEALVAADRDRANDRLTTTVQVGLGLTVLALLGAVLLGRSVSRSLRLLAGQAHRISEGELVEVEVHGPREVQTVSSALGEAVAGLRRIQDQAQAVARGDLDNAVLDQSLPGPLGEVVHASVREIVHSVRQREELQYALAHQATHDPLTELPNRAHALTLVTAALHRGQRSGEMTGLLFVDLDGFKAVNDGHGHAAGDEVLQEIAHRLRAAVRPGDVACRLGGDEFVVLVEPVKGEADLLELAERLIAAVSEPMTADGALVRVGASVGVAVSRDGGTDAGVLFAEADTAAYRAKRHGRGRAEIFDDALRAQLTARAELEAAIAHGLAHGEMQLYYQPVIDVGSDRITGYEALVRWNRPGHGMVAPDQFIPVAEGSRLICDLDRWVLHEATRQLGRVAGALAGTPEPTIAVNISGRHLTARRVVTDVADALAASGLPAELLVLEVTETVLIDDPVAIDHLAALREMGVGIAIDDFGTGYTSIGQLRHMPVDTLKIDRSFVSSVEPGHRELVALIIRAAHTFGMTVVAEGVEEPDQLARLKAQACDRAQGYLMYRPMPAADAGALLSDLTGVLF